MRAKVAIASLLAIGLLAGCGGGGGSTSTSTQAPRAKPEPGGEKSIEEFGREAEGSGRSALLSVFSGYLGALAAEDYATACSHLAATVRRSLEQLVVKKLKAKGCAAILPKLLATSAATIARGQAAGHITKVRVEGDRAFVVFGAPGARLYQLPMAREGGEWKASLVSPSILVPSPATLGQ